MHYQCHQINETNVNGQFIFTDDETFVVDQQYLDNCVDKQTIRFLENIGGSEEIIVTGNETKIISICPMNIHKTIRHFTMINE